MRELTLTIYPICSVLLRRRWSFNLALSRLPKTQRHLLRSPSFLRYLLASQSAIWMPLRWHSRHEIGENVTAAVAAAADWPDRAEPREGPKAASRASHIPVLYLRPPKFEPRPFAKCLPASISSSSSSSTATETEPPTTRSARMLS